MDFIGGFSALVEKGFTTGDLSLIEAIPEALAQTERVCASINVASTRAGINMDAVYLMGQTIKEAAAKTAHATASPVPSSASLPTSPRTFLSWPVPTWAWGNRTP